MRRALYALLGAVIVLVRGWPPSPDNPPTAGWEAGHGHGSLWGWDGASLEDYTGLPSSPGINEILDH
jgi:hypothetical protein